MPHLNAHVKRPMSLMNFENLIVLSVVTVQFIKPNDATESTNIYLFISSMFDIRGVYDSRTRFLTVHPSRFTKQIGH
jgi:hypothetical protein